MSTAGSEPTRAQNYTAIQVTCSDAWATPAAIEYTVPAKILIRPLLLKDRQTHIKAS